MDRLAPGLARERSPGAWAPSGLRRPQTPARLGVWFGSSRGEGAALTMGTTPAFLNQNSDPSAAFSSDLCGLTKAVTFN